MFIFHNITFPNSHTGSNTSWIELTLSLRKERGVGALQLFFFATWFFSSRPPPRPLIQTKSLYRAFCREHLTEKEATHLNPSSGFATCFSSSCSPTSASPLSLNITFHLRLTCTQHGAVYPVQS